MERQREAARRAALMSHAAPKDALLAADAGAKPLLARPAAPSAPPAAGAKAGETGSKALPRLKQAMEARQQLFAANLRTLELAHKAKARAAARPQCACQPASADA